MAIVRNEPLLPLPTTPEDLARCLADPEWRLFSGSLYKRCTVAVPSPPDRL